MCINLEFTSYPLEMWVPGQNARSENPSLFSFPGDGFLPGESSSLHLVWACLILVVTQSELLAYSFTPSTRVYQKAQASPLRSCQHFRRLVLVLWQPEVETWQLTQVVTGIITPPLPPQLGPSFLWKLPCTFCPKGCCRRAWERDRVLLPANFNSRGFHKVVFSPPCPPCTMPPDSALYSQ